MKEKKKVALWGIGNEFGKIFPKVISDEEKNYFEIVALIDTNKMNQSIYDRQIVSPIEVNYKEIDYIIISTQRYYWNIYYELISLGVDSNSIIAGIVFLNEDFDFELYEINGQIKDNIRGNYFEDTTYNDYIRMYKRKNLFITLGRKSYIGKTKIVDGGYKGKVTISIGNYTSIAWDCTFDLALNLDHDYSRILNYGMSHLSEGLFEEKKISNCSIEIGSDVWIGYDVVIKSGVKIGDGAVIAAHSVVVNDVEPFTIVGGNPAKYIKRRFSDDICQALKSSEWWNWSVEKLLKYKDLFDSPEDFIKKLELNDDNSMCEKK